MTRRPLRWYRGQPIGVRLHLLVRWATSPMGPLVDRLPESGRILDWGCGHGLLAVWAAARAPQRTVVGVDVDEGKLAVARAAAAAAGQADRVVFEPIAPTARPDGTWDAIVVNDVLYLLDPADQEALVRAAARALAPGAVLTCVEMGERPRWKVAVAELQERLAVHALRITAAPGGLHRYPAPAAVAAWMRDEGLAVELEDLGSGYHVPHVAVHGRRGSESGPAGSGW